MVSKYQITGILQKSGRNDDHLSRLHKYNPDPHGNMEKLRDFGRQQLKQSRTSGTSGTKKTDSVMRFDGEMSTAHRLHEEYMASLRSK